MPSSIAPEPDPERTLGHGALVPYDPRNNRRRRKHSDSKSTKKSSPSSARAYWKSMFHPPAQPKSQLSATPSVSSGSSTVSPSRSTSSLGSSFGDSFSRTRSESSVSGFAKPVAPSSLHVVPEAEPEYSQDPARLVDPMDSTSTRGHRMIPVQKDGETVWIPESLVDRYSAVARDAQSSATSTRSRRPDMKIAIPQEQASQQPPPRLDAESRPRRRPPPPSIARTLESSTNSDGLETYAVFPSRGERYVHSPPDRSLPPPPDRSLPPPPNRSLPSPPDRSRPLHPLEHAGMVRHASVGSTPVSPESHGSSYSPGAWSPISSQQSTGTSRSSVEVTTPPDLLPSVNLQLKSLRFPSPPSKSGRVPARVPPAVQSRDPRRSSTTLGSLSPASNRSNPRAEVNTTRSSTVSQAASDLERELSLRGLTTPDLIMRILAEYQTTPHGTPPIPRRSVRRSHPNTIPVRCETPCRSNRESVAELSNAVYQRPEEFEGAYITPDTAERVIYEIFLRVQGLKDLFSLARINHGFYDVFKRNELVLVKAALRNQDPSAWSHLEVSRPPIVSSVPSRERLGSDHSFYSRYLQRLRRDTYILTELKTCILTHCDSFIRFETAEALKCKDPAGVRKVDNALWRIWTFCDLFGSVAKRENDVTAQTAWLRQSDDSKLSVNDTAEQSLSADDLYDMTELWNCMRCLLSSIQGSQRLAQARAHGIFAGHDEIPDDIPAMQEFALEEWINHLLALGPAVVSELSKHIANTDDTVFAVAVSRGWSFWEPPSPLYGKGSISRGNFLKEAVSIVYEEKLAAEAKARRDATPSTTPSTPTTPSQASIVRPRARPERNTTQSRNWAILARRARGLAFATELKEIKAANTAALLSGKVPSNLKQSKRISDERPMSLLADILEKERALKAKKQRAKPRKSRLRAVTTPGETSPVDTAPSTPRETGTQPGTPTVMPLRINTLRANAETDLGGLTPAVETPMAYPPAMAALMAKAAATSLPPVPKIPAALQAQVVKPQPVVKAVPVIRKPVPVNQETGVAEADKPAGAIKPAEASTPAKAKKPLEARRPPPIPRRPSTVVKMPRAPAVIPPAPAIPEIKGIWSSTPSLAMIHPDAISASSARPDGLVQMGPPGLAPSLMTAPVPALTQTRRRTPSPSSRPAPIPATVRAPSPHKISAPIPIQVRAAPPPPTCPPLTCPLPACPPPAVAPTSMVAEVPTQGTTSAPALDSPPAQSRCPSPAPVEHLKARLPTTAQPTTPPQPLPCSEYQTSPAPPPPSLPPPPPPSRPAPLPPLTIVKRSSTNPTRPHSAQPPSGPRSPKAKPRVKRKHRERQPRKSSLASMRATVPNHDTMSTSEERKKLLAAQMPRSKYAAISSQANCESPTEMTESPSSDPASASAMTAEAPSTARDRQYAEATQNEPIQDINKDIKQPEPKPKAMARPPPPPIPAVIVVSPEPSISSPFDVSSPKNATCITAIPCVAKPVSVRSSRSSSSGSSVSSVRRLSGSSVGQRSRSHSESSFSSNGGGGGFVSGDEERENVDRKGASKIAEVGTIITTTTTPTSHIQSMSSNPETKPRSKQPSKTPGPPQTTRKQSLPHASSSKHPKPSTNHPSHTSHLPSFPLHHALNAGLQKPYTYQQSSWTPLASSSSSSSSDHPPSNTTITNKTNKPKTDGQKIKEALGLGMMGVELGIGMGHSMGMGMDSGSGLCVGRLPDSGRVVVWDLGDAGIGKGGFGKSGVGIRGAASGGGGGKRRVVEKRMEGRDGTEGKGEERVVDVAGGWY